MQCNKIYPVDISVVIPCHNDGDYLEGSVSSVLQQALPDNVQLEVIIVDDCSDDEATIEILQGFSSAENCVRVLHRDTAGGAAVARNTGVTAAEGSWIAFLDADDVWLPNALALRWEVVTKYPDAQWIGGDHILFWDDGREEGEGFFASRESPKACLSQAFATHQPLYLSRPVSVLLEAMPVWTGTVMVKKILLEELDGFDPQYKQAEDNHLWLRLAERTDFYFIPQILARYRQRSGSLTATTDSPHMWDYHILCDLLKRPEFGNEVSKIKQRMLHDLQQDIWFQRENKKFSKALRSAYLACRLAPFVSHNWRNLLTTCIAASGPRKKLNCA